MIDAFIAFMAGPDIVTGPMNLGNPTECSILELAEKIIGLTKAKSDIVLKPLPENDPIQRKPDISFARRELQWQPAVTLEEGLSKTIQYFKWMVTG